VALVRFQLRRPVEGFDQGAFVGYALQSGIAQAQSRRTIREDTRAVVRDETLADGPGIVALRNSTSNVVSMDVGVEDSVLFVFDGWLGDRGIALLPSVAEYIESVGLSDLRAVLTKLFPSIAAGSPWASSSILTSNVHARAAR